MRETQALGSLARATSPQLRQFCCSGGGTDGHLRRLELSAMKDRVQEPQLIRWYSRINRWTLSEPNPALNDSVNVVVLELLAFVSRRAVGWGLHDLERRSSSSSAASQALPKPCFASDRHLADQFESRLAYAKLGLGQRPAIRKRTRPCPNSSGSSRFSTSPSRRSFAPTSTCPSASGTAGLSARS